VFLKITSFRIVKFSTYQPLETRCCAAGQDARAESSTRRFMFSASARTSPPFDQAAEPERDQQRDADRKRRLQDEQERDAVLPMLNPASSRRPSSSGASPVM